MSGPFTIERLAWETSALPSRQLLVGLAVDTNYWAVLRLEEWPEHMAHLCVALGALIPVQGLDQVAVGVPGASCLMGTRATEWAMMGPGRMWTFGDDTGPLPPQWRGMEARRNLGHTSSPPSEPIQRITLATTMAVLKAGVPARFNHQLPTPHAPVFTRTVEKALRQLRG